MTEVQPCYYAFGKKVMFVNDASYFGILIHCCMGNSSLIGELLIQKVLGVDESIKDQTQMNHS